MAVIIDFEKMRNIRFKRKPGRRKILSDDIVVHISRMPNREEFSYYIGPDEYKSTDQGKKEFLECLLVMIADMCSDDPSIAFEFHQMLEDTLLNDWEQGQDD